MMTVKMTVKMKMTLMTEIMAPSPAHKNHRSEHNNTKLRHHLRIKNRMPGLGPFSQAILLRVYLYG
jgi:hypothetical protein